jgi:phosphate transport system permease protein
MPDDAAEPRDPRTPDPRAERSRLRGRRLRDKVFMGMTIAALCVAAVFIVVFIGNLLLQGAPALRQAYLDTTVTYNQQTVNDPRTAFPEAIRDYVSRDRVRDIPRQGKRVRVKLPIDFAAATASDPAAGLSALTLEKEAFPPWIRNRLDGPVTVPRETVLAFVGQAGLRQIADAAAQRATAGDPPADPVTEMWLWGHQDISNFIQFGEALEGDARDLAVRLEEADRVEQVFNSLDFGEGTTRQEWVLAMSDVDQYLKGYDNKDPRTYPDPSRAPLTLAQVEELDRLHGEGKIALRFNSGFFLNGDSNQPEAAGVLPAVWGSVMVLTIVFLLAVPIGVLTSIYLEEFAPDNWLTQGIEVNINNLAAVPSILFGVLGLAALINFLGMPRSSALVGGATLTLMTLPVVIISSRAALRAVPDSIRRAAYGMGATRWQVVTHHVLPLAIPGIMTGAIIGIAQAMGETAPLIIIGLIAFIPDPASGILDPTTVMPAQIFNWWGNSLTGFTERAALMILVLLVVLFLLNGLAVFIRARFEKQW